MLVLSKNEMQRADLFTKKKLGIFEEILMENAGLAIANSIKKMVNSFSKIVVCCGSGNNGGDGIVVARRLKQLGFDVDLVFVNGIDGFSKSTAYHFKIYCNCGFDYFNLEKISGVSCKIFDNADFIVDAVFGVGFHGEADKKISKIFQLINSVSAKVFSVDIPSGVCADYGCFKNAIKADYTFVVSYLKRSAFLFPSKANYGNIILIDADIVLNPVDFKNCAKTWNVDNFKQTFVFKQPNDNKWSCGSGLLVGGCCDMIGAVILAAKACLKSGIGLLKLAVVDSLKISVSNSILEATYADVDEKEGVLSNVKIENRFDVISCGPGLSRNNLVKGVVKKVILSDSAIVLDADALFFLDDELLQLIKNRKKPTILTPHVREMAKICNCSVDCVEKNRFELSVEKAKSWNVILVLKGPHTLITAPTGEQFVNLSGNESLAKGGTGDVLTGIITSCVARFVALKHETSLVHMVCNAVFVHGYAAEILVRAKKAKQSVSASDVIECLSDVFAEFECEV